MPESKRIRPDEIAYIRRVIEAHDGLDDCRPVLMSVRQVAGLLAEIDHLTDAVDLQQGRVADLRGALGVARMSHPGVA